MFPARKACPASVSATVLENWQDVLFCDLAVGWDLVQS